MGAAAALTYRQLLLLVGNKLSLLVAIIVAALIPLFMALVGGMPALLLSFVGLMIVPSLLAKLVFGSAASWILVLVLNAIYAIAAMATYKAIARN